MVVRGGILGTKRLVNTVTKDGNEMVEATKRMRDMSRTYHACLLTTTQVKRIDDLRSSIKKAYRAYMRMEETRSKLY